MSARSKPNAFDHCSVVPPESAIVPIGPSISSLPAL